MSYHLLCHVFPEHVLLKSSLVPEGEFYLEFNGTFPSTGFGKCSYLNKAFSFASWWDEAICICAILYCCIVLHLHTRGQPSSVLLCPGMKLFVFGSQGSAEPQPDGGAVSMLIVLSTLSSLFTAEEGGPGKC